jgi:hypothetical protein
MNDNTTQKPMNVAEVIRKVRKVEATIKELEAQFDAEKEPYEKMAEAGRAVLLKYLNDTGQRSAATAEGGCNKRTKVSFQVRDREAFKKEIIDNEAWEMIAWRANDAVCEDYVQAHKKSPPGTYRNAIDILTVTAPAKPRLRKKKPGTLTEEEWAEIEREVDEEQAALESNMENGEVK